MRHLLDTNVVSELVARRPSPRVVRWVDGLEPYAVFLSVITVGELWKGISKLQESKRKTELQRWLEGDLLLRFEGRILALDADVMATWGEMMGRLESTGRTLPAMDSLIAAIALHHDCVLATRNEDDFAGTGVRMANPWT